MGCTSSTLSAKFSKEAFPKLVAEDDRLSEFSVTSISEEEMEKAYKDIEDDDDVNPGELAQFRRTAEQYIRKSVSNITSVDVYEIEDKTELDKISSQISRIGDICTVLEGKTSHARIIDFQKDILKVINKIGLDTFCCEIIHKYNTKKRYTSHEDENDEAALSTLLEKCVYFLWAYSEISEEFSVRVAKSKDVLEFAKKVLLDGQKEISANVEDLNWISDNNSETDERWNAEYEENDEEEIEHCSEEEENQGSRECSISDNNVTSDGFLNDKECEESDNDEQQGTSERNVSDNDEGCGEANNDAFPALVSNVLTLIYHTSLWDDNIARLRKLDFLSVLLPYLKFSRNVITFCTIANIVNEKECKIIDDHRDIVETILDGLKDAFNEKSHKAKGWSCQQYGLAIRRLAHNDRNKRMLYELGAVELLVKLADADDENEKYGGVHGLWSLAFDKYVRKKMANEQKLGAVDILQELSQSKIRRIKDASNKALWTMRIDLKNSRVSSYRTIVHDLKKRTENAERKQTTDVMISYQWADQETIKVICEGLKKAGLKKAMFFMQHLTGFISHSLFAFLELLMMYHTLRKTFCKFYRRYPDVIRKYRRSLNHYCNNVFTARFYGDHVWIDIERMEGSIIEAMANAVDNSTVVLLCMSRRYKNSENCRAEAMYANKQKKVIIPLKMERDYKEDGWLSFIIGQQLFYDFSGKYKFETKLKELIHAVKQHCKK